MVFSGRKGKEVRFCFLFEKRSADLRSERKEKDFSDVLLTSKKENVILKMGMIQMGKAVKYDR